MYDHESGKKVAAALYFTPVAAQATRVIGKFVMKSGEVGKKGPGLAGNMFSTVTKLLSAVGLMHVLGHGLVDQVRTLAAPLLVS